MLTRLFLVYLLAEFTVLAVLVSTIGFGRTVLVLLATFVIGVMLACSQVRRQLTRLRGQHAVTDGALTALGAVLVLIPGLVTTVAGLLLLLPVSRAALRPVLATAAVGRLGRWLPPVTNRTTNRDDYIDGEVIDVVDGDARILPVDRAIP